MSTVTENSGMASRVQSLVQLLRSRSYEEIRQRMYDNPPGSTWWSACKTEIDIRNGERTATALVETSRVMDKMRVSTDHLDALTEKLVQATSDMSQLLKNAKESGRRIEIATYVIVGVAIMQLFYVIFQIAGRR
jgi:tetrahydromethanopterin S-methyltransferase subunit G